MRTLLPMSFGFMAVPIYLTLTGEKVQPVVAVLGLIAWAIVVLDYFIRLNSSNPLEQ